MKLQLSNSSIVLEEKRVRKKQINSISNWDPDKSFPLSFNEPWLYRLRTGVG